MRVAVIGSRQINVYISKYILKKAIEIITGGAVGIDLIAEEYVEIYIISEN